MRTLKILFVVSLTTLALTGCVSLGKIVEDVQEVDATTEIAAVYSLTKDIIDNPWDNMVNIGIGYVLALLRRKYKQIKGAK